MLTQNLEELQKIKKKLLDDPHLKNILQTTLPHDFDEAIDQIQAAIEVEKQNLCGVLLEKELNEREDWC